MRPNTTGPPWTVGRQTARAPGGRPARWPVGSIADDKRQTTTDDDRRQRAKQYWPIRRASNNSNN